LRLGRGAGGLTGSLMGAPARLRKLFDGAACQPHGFAVISELPIKRLTQATPRGRASSPLNKETSPHISIHSSLRATGFPIGMASPEKGAGSTITILTTGLNLDKVPVCEAARGFSQRSCSRASMRNSAKRVYCKV